MQPDKLRNLLDAVRTGETSIDDALARLQRLPFETTETATIDHHRSLRCGFAEVVYCAGKTPKQVADIFAKLVRAGGNTLATRATAEHARAVLDTIPDAIHHETARCITHRAVPAKESTGAIVLVSAGTSDLPVLEEARVTCEIMDQPTKSLTDVGVAGIHRLLDKTELLQAARVIVAVAGMDGALPGVISGLVRAPIIAVPTSVGYGAAFGGLAPLLTMLNACAPGVAVVNIDNGFAAGTLAAMINRIGEPDG